MSSRWWAVAVMTASLSLAGCAIASESTPRDIPVQFQDTLLDAADRDAGASTGTARIYLLSPDAQSGLIVAVARDVAETPLDLLNALLAGPNETEFASQFRTALPNDLEIRSAQLRGGTLVVDISSGLVQLTGDTLIRAIAQIVFTASDAPGVRAVQLLIEGNPQQWPTGRGALQSEPLTVYDYPGLVASAQPAYPATPSPD